MPATEPTRSAASATVEAEPQQQQATSRLGSRLLIIGFVVAAVILQLIIASIFLSRFAKSAPTDTATIEEQVEQEIDDELFVNSDSGALTVEVELGEFTVTAYRPSSELALRIDFRLFGTIIEENMDEFLRRFQRNQNRVREQVLVTMRNAELTDLTDPGLGLIKRRILTKVNRTLGKPLLRTVIISDFSFLEQ